MEISKQIKKYRNEMNLRQEELAEKIYVTRQTISNWENDKSYPDIHSLLLLSSLFGISVDHLVKGDLEIMKTEINKEEMHKLKFYGNIFTGLFIITVIASVPLMVYLGILYGGIAEAILWAVTMAVALKVEKMKKQNDIQTYKEIKAFFDGQHLDEIVKNREIGKRPYQKFLLAVGGGLAALVIAILMLKLLSVI